MAYIIDRGVLINGKHSYRDWGLMLVNTSIEAPKPKTKSISIPFRNGDIDLTEVNDTQIKYDNRTIKIKFRKIGDFDANKVLVDELINDIHGISTHLIFDDDFAYFYSGRITDIDYSRDMDKLNITITADCDPYKYNIESTAEEWLWDDFDFEYGIINDAKDKIIDNKGIIEIVSERGGGIPTIITDKPIQIDFEGIKHTLRTNQETYYDYNIKAGSNFFKINTVYDEVATVTIDYRGGKL
jgi:hypothetical protein